jgi:hypothetical protein
VAHHEFESETRLQQGLADSRLLAMSSLASSASTACQLPTPTWDRYNFHSEMIVEGVIQHLPLIVASPATTKSDPERRID